MMLLLGIIKASLNRDKKLADSAFDRVINKQQGQSVCQCSIPLQSIGASEMKKSILAIATAAALFATGTQAHVTYHEPDQQMEKNLNVYGTGIVDWEYSKFARYAMIDSHKIHYWAEIPAPAEKMPMKKAAKQLDVSKITVPDVVPGNTISMYNLMRDRAEISSYVIMNKKGEIIAEDYWNNSKVDTKHQLHSANKSFTSMAWAAVEATGLVSADEIAETYIKELKGTPWGKIKMRHYLDMTSGSNTMDMSREGWHNWEMPDGNVTDSSMSTVAGYAGLVEKDGKLVPPVQAENAKGITRLSEYLELYAKNHDPEWEAGEKYQYRCLNTEMVAMALVRTTGKPLAEVYDEYLWSKGGFNNYGALYVNQDKDSIGSGSFNTTTRDFAIGSFIMANGGKNWKGEQVVPESFVKEVEKGDPVVKKAWAQISYEGLAVPTGAWYKNQFRTLTDPETGVDFSMMLGTNGQVSAWDHKTGNVIAIFGDYRRHTGQALIHTYFFDVIKPLFKRLADEQATS